MEAECDFVNDVSFDQGTTSGSRLFEFTVDSMAAERRAVIGRSTGPKQLIAGDFLDARRVALIGATAGERDRWSYNARMTRSLLGSSFEDVVLVSRREGTIDGRRTLEHISEAAGQPGDLCVVVVPHAVLGETIADCADAGWSRVLVITGQLDRNDRQAVLRSVPDRARMWGPNCVGFVAVESNRRVMASDFAPLNRAGRPRLAIGGQSGGALSNIASLAQAYGLNISHIMSTGDEIDVSIEDLLMYLASKRPTDAVALFVEQARHPDAFLAGLDACAEAELPVAIVKVGRSARALAAAKTHSGALVGDADEFDLAVSAHGAVVCRSFRDAAGVATIATHGRSRRIGRRTAFFTSSGGTGALACDLAERHKLTLARFSTDSADRLRQLLSSPSSEINPFDSALGGGTPPSMPTYLGAICSDDNVDVIIILHTGDVYAAFIAAQLEGCSQGVSAMLAVWPGIESGIRDRIRDAGIPVLDDLDDACRWIELVVAARDARETGRHSSCAPRTDLAQPGGSNESDEGKWLTYDAGSALLRQSGIDAPQQWRVDTVEHAAEFEDSIENFPVFLKAAAMTGHKFASGGVKRVDTMETLKTELARMVRAFGPTIVEGGAPSGVEVLIAVRRGSLGGVMMLGLGGAFADRFGKQIVLPASAGLTAIERALQVSPISSVLEGSLDRPVVPLALHRIALAATQLVSLVDSAELETIEVNPFIVSNGRCVACDIKATVRSEKTHEAQVRESRCP